MRCPVESVTFLVQGSVPDPYEVTFQRDGERLSAACTCPAGQLGQHCKHRLRILAGDDEAIVSGNIPDVATVVGWLPGTHLEAAIADLREAEDQAEQAKRIVTAAKRKLGRVLQG